MEDQPGPTEEFPNGKMNEDDEGELQIAIYAYDGRVILRFGKPVSWIGFPAEHAEELATLIYEKAQLAKNQKQDEQDN